jgi:segregation and condensation protein A
MIRPRQHGANFHLGAHLPGQRMSTSEYRVALELFGGPMDLLLYLVRRDELDILDLPLARIATQFLEFIEVLELLDVSQAADFVSTASTLAEIKSRTVLPRQEEEAPTEEPLEDEPQNDLVHKLLEFKRLREASQALEAQAALWQERFPRLSDERPRQGRDLADDLIKEVELWDLVSALARVLRRRTVEHEASVRYDDTPISVYIERVGERVRREGRVAFSALFDAATKRGVVVGLFLAILELLRHHAFRAEQPVDYGEIWILPPVTELAGTETAHSGTVDPSAAPPADASPAAP